jgi:hypothetical protein
MADIWEITLQQQAFGNTMKNVIHMSSAENSFSPEFIATDIQNYFTPPIRVVQVSSWKYLFIHVKKLNEQGGNTWIHECLNIGGNYNYYMMPPALCVLFELQTGILDRSHRGKMWISGLGNNYMGEDGLNPSGMNDLKNVYNSLAALYCTPNSTTPLTWGVWSRKLSVFTPINGVRILRRYGVQRRRNVNQWGNG